ncbi:ATP-binding protein [Desulfopila sp. IMCC35008]|uniref:ATP-binding protein n=1 Tax=Desulfopila sp. IMCC35008 TaxID=2653858 RepID=UPI0013D8D354|nr:ATP-binding protein [Desulfopila sp. IMCC35008]
MHYLKNLSIEDLLHEIGERQEVQQKLAHAQKMEAIGTLADGVAHDLNNILSGVVSYPDLLLMQLEEDSPLRKPIKTIRSSGKKAAAIVQDLLPLARRGVKVEDNIELGAIITSYMESPEYRELLNNHPGVTINFSQSDNEYTMVGSPVHLSKTVMNLVANSVEAIQEPGTVDITLEHKYLSRRPPGFENWQAGNYICLTVADTGIGIEKQYLDRIYEPFYSRKVMGKSGTGLGMAVVWGSVEDHRGYITVESTVGEGTSFSLFFPASRPPQSPVSEVITQPGKQYRGNGQSILVVDDSRQQRQIATEILTHLGYKETSANGGEEAIRYLKANYVDLVILDMLMEPGINGLETYKHILEFRPGQKAIIASGYSNSDPVQEARVLGISEYVEKPYTVTRIGKAVHRILTAHDKVGKAV